MHTQHWEAQTVIPTTPEGVPEKIQRACKKIGVRAVFKSSGTLRELLTRVKRPIPEMSKKDIVYQIQCRDCYSVYIEETGGSLERRVTEYKYVVKTGDGRKNGVAEHAWDEGHAVDWKGVRILECEQNYWKRRTLKAIWIKKTGERNSNLDCGLMLKQTWLAYIQ